MTNMLQDGVAWLASKLTDNASERVTYRDAEGNETTFTATVTEETSEQRDSQVGTIIVRKRIVTILNPGIDTPNTRGVMIVSETEYAVTTCNFKDEARSMMVFQIERQETADKSRENYRRRNI